MTQAKSILYFLMAASCAGASGGMAHATGNPDAGKKTFQACKRCHTLAPTDRQQPIPRLGGQHAQFIIASLQSYTDGERKNADMQRIAAALSEQDKNDIAAFVAQFELKNFPIPQSGKAIGFGKIIENCRVCHGVGGNSFVPEYPRINGQNENYLIKALKSYRNGTRNNPTMTYVVKDLTEKELLEIADYYANQKEGLTVIDK